MNKCICGKPGEKEYFGDMLCSKCESYLKKEKERRKQSITNIMLVTQQELFPGYGPLETYPLSSSFYVYDLDTQYFFLLGIHAETDKQLVLLGIFKNKKAAKNVKYKINDLIAMGNKHYKVPIEVESYEVIQ